MLSSITIKNFILINELSIDFSEGFNIITGETGSGKSLILKGISILLGGKFSNDFIRKGEKSSEVIGIFKINKIIDEYEDEIIIRRVVSEKGQKTYINDTPVTIKRLKEIMGQIIELTSQHSSQKLFDKEFQLSLVDSIVDKDNYDEKYSLYNSIQKDLESYKKQKSDGSDREEFLDFKVKEIDSLNIVDEDFDLEEKISSIENEKKITEISSEMNELLFGEDNSLMEHILQVAERSKEFDKFSGKDTYSLFKGVENVLDDVAKEINFKEPSEDLDELYVRVEELSKIKKKNGGSLEAVLEKREEYFKELEILQDLDENITRGEHDLIVAKEEAINYGKILSKQRKKKAKEMSKEITEVIQKLNMKGAEFTIEVNSGEEIRKNGMDEVSFMITSNKGEDSRELMNIASGGELSRIMLAIFVVNNEKLPIVFDEIDGGIGGNTGTVVGEYLRKLSETTQVIAITHLGQIAALSDSHIQVEKSEVNSRVISKGIEIKEEQQLEELARMLSGELSTESLELAKKLKGV
jgi:DNA repair protein RecN (Recombination protein N)